MFHSPKIYQLKRLHTDAASLRPPTKYSELDLEYVGNTGVLDRESDKFPSVSYLGKRDGHFPFSIQ